MDGRGWMERGWMGGVGWEGLDGRGWMEGDGWKGMDGRRCRRGGSLRHRSVRAIRAVTLISTSRLRGARCAV